MQAVDAVLAWSRQCTHCAFACLLTGFPRVWQIETQIKKMRGTAPGKELQHHFSASDALMGKGPFDPTRKYSHYNFDNMAARLACSVC